MADPTQLQGQIYQTFSQGVDGYDPREVQGALRRDQNYKREQLKSLYDVTADLDAASMSALKNELDGIYSKIDSGELNLATPAFTAAKSRLNSTAIGLKETQDMTQQTLADAAKNPENVSYIVTDEYGRKKDLGYEGLVTAMSDFSSGQYERPEEYITTGSSALSNVGRRVDEQDLEKSVRKSVNEDVENYIRSKGMDEKEVKKQMYAYRTGARSIVDQMPEPVRTKIAEDNYMRFQNMLGAQFATVNARENLPQDDDEQSWGKRYIKEFVPTAVGDVDDFTQPRFISDKSDRTDLSIRRNSGGGGWSNEDFDFEKISDDEIRVSARDLSDPNPAWNVLDELVGGKKGIKGSLVSIVEKDGDYFAKITREDYPGQPTLAPITDNANTLRSYGLSVDVLDDMFSKKKEDPDNDKANQGVGAKYN